MVSFSSLPQELVDYIVELAAPPFAFRTWKERQKLLKALCLTSRNLHRPARKLLYRDIVLSSSHNAELLAHDPLQPAIFRDLAPIQKLVVELGREMWMRTDDGQAALSAILKRNKLKEVVSAEPCQVNFADLRTAVSIFVDTNNSADAFLPHSLRPQHRFHFLRRLTLRNLFLDAPLPPFTSDVFPALVSFDMYEVHYGDRDDESTSVRLILDTKVVPLTYQLRAAAVAHVNDIGTGLACQVLDIYCFPTGDREISRIPSSVEVLRIYETTGGNIHALIASPFFPPSIKEVHFSKMIGSSSVEMEAKGRTACEEGGIAFFYEPEET